MAGPIVSAGPLTRIETTADLNCAVNHVDDEAGAFYGDTACGTFLVVDDELFSPASVPAGIPGTGWTPVSQSDVTGDGSPGNPYRYTTTVAAGDTGVTVAQTDSYVVGQESYRTDVVVTNTGAARDLRLYRAGDCYLADSDIGLGAVDADSGAVACTSPESDRIEQFRPLSPGSHYYEAGYYEVWERISDRLAFPDTCRCDESIDNGAGLQWDLSLGSGQSATRSSLLTFSPDGSVPLETAKTVDDPEVGTGDVVTYAVTVSNPGATSETLSTITDELPAGFTYVPGSTSGATTDDPVEVGGALSWTVDQAIAAGGQSQLTFDATVSDVPGTYPNNAGGSAVDVFVTPTGDTAPVTVVEDDPVEVAPVTDLQGAGAGSGSVVLTWTNPEQLDGIVVRYATDGPPATPDEGTGVPVVGAPETVTVNGLDDATTYYFTVFATLGGDVSPPTSITVQPFACPDLVPALDAAAGLVTGAAWEACSAPDAHEPSSTLDIPLPTTGAGQALMTTGDRALAAPPSDSDGEGRDNGTGSRGAYDVSIYRLDLAVPAGAQCLSFDYVFASEEYPEYVGGSFNDGFLAQLDQQEWSVDEGSNITATGNFARIADDYVSVNSAVFADPDQVLLPPENGTEYDGMSRPLRAQTPVTPGTHRVYLSIFDAGDGILDSAVFLDNLRTTAAACSAGTVVQQPPVAVDDSATTVANTAVTTQVLANDSDPNGDPLTVSAHTQGTNGTVTCSAAACQYTPGAGWTGQDSYTYTVSDGQGGTDVGTVTVTVTNRAPVANNDTASVQAGQSVEVAVLANDSDPDGHPLTVTTASPAAAKGTVACGATSCTYTAGAGASGTDTFTYAVSDGRGGTDTATVTVTISGVPASITAAVADGSLVWPQQAEVSGTVRRGDGSAMPSVQVQLWARPAGGEWAPVGTPRTSSASGAISQAHRPQKATTYQWRSVVGAVSSPERSVTVAPALVARLSAGRVGPGAPVTVSGTSSPARAGATVLLQQKVSGSWKTVASTTFAQGSTETTGGAAYSFEISREKSRRYQLRVLVPADDDRLARAGSTLSLLVHQARITGVKASGDEFVKVRNTGTVALDLGGWKLRDKQGNAVRLPSRSVAPGAVVRIHSGRGRNDRDDLYLRVPDMWNRRDTATLVDNLGWLISRLRY